VRHIFYSRRFSFFLRLYLQTRVPFWCQMGNFFVGLLFFPLSKNVVDSDLASITEIKEARPARICLKIWQFNSFTKRVLIFSSPFVSVFRRGYRCWFPCSFLTFFFVQGGKRSRDSFVLLMIKGWGLNRCALRWDFRPGHRHFFNLASKALDDQEPELSV
jgi:hypothetical protein